MADLPASSCSSCNFADNQNENENAFDGIAPSTSDHSSNRMVYDVFINHRGPDVKKSFASILYHYLRDKGLLVFLDSEEIQLGDNVPAKIEDAIHSASVHIAIFSQKYAESPWCLAELSLMLKSGGKVFPVFYDVRPSDLRYIEKGVYADALIQHEQKGRYISAKLDEWKKALYNASFISGMEFNSLNDDMGQLLTNLASTVLQELKMVPLLEVAKYPVGLDEAVKDFEKQMLGRGEHDQNQSENVKIVGIVGIGGAGKTTLATELYNRKSYSEFSRRSFLFDVREASARNELPALQSKLLKDLLGIDSTFHSIGEGKQELRKYLKKYSSPILIILDDIDHMNQLDALLVKDILISESLIIITSRDKGVLKRSGISLIYEIEMLDSKHAEELFCWHAFSEPHPISGFEDLVGDFLRACSGLPLSLQVLGRHVFGTYDRDYWQSTLDKLSKIMHDDIKNRLEISYAALDEEEKKIFLDVACFFIETDTKEKITAIRIWDASGWSGLHGLQTLEWKCLVDIVKDKFTGKEYLRMHNQLRDMGREIADQHLPRRLYRHGEAERPLGGVEFRNILAVTTNGSCRELRGVDYSYSINGGSILCLIVNEGVEGNFNEGSKDVLYLSWYDCPHGSIPSWLPMKRLQILELKRGELEGLWQSSAQAPLQLRELWISYTPRLRKLPKSIGVLKHLQKIVFSGLFYMRTLPDEMCSLHSLKHFELSSKELTSLPIHFGNLTNLQYLNLSRCTKLKLLPESFTGLKQLRYLCLEFCTSLQELPPTLGKLASLTELGLDGCEQLKSLSESWGHLNLRLPSGRLHVSGCKQLKYLPESLGQVRYLLSHLIIDRSGVECLPRGLGFLSTLQSLAVTDCPLRELMLTNATAIGETQYSMKSEQSNNPIDGCMVGLKSILLRSTKVSKICISGDYCPKLESLDLLCNKYLVEVDIVTVSPSLLNYMNLRNCSSLKRISGVSDLANLQRLELGGCCKLEELPGLSGLSSLKWLLAGGCWKRQSICDLEHLKQLIEFRISPGRTVIWNSIQQLQILPSINVLRGSVEPILKFFNFPNILVVDILQQSDRRGLDDFYSDYYSESFQLQTKVNPCNAFLLCFLVEWDNKIKDEESIEVTISTKMAWLSGSIHIHHYIGEIEKVWAVMALKDEEQNMRQIFQKLGRDVVQ
eukprot:Gb_40546 [translate_table: standard]